ncbi:hypothetical protein BDV96DRAFT_582197 [Lophiotrema nucula]|uniref:Uncharacterized protein n=1 Tax=Lophiotrema nucula TaxID=690887 RepID=A0A6A5YWH1_9PLEO|nr:hypothetical protein BDV96DRAFT_582197 [Lophiotrema nucula]
MSTAKIPTSRLLIYVAQARQICRDTIVNNQTRGQLLHAIAIDILRLKPMVWKTQTRCIAPTYLPLLPHPKTLLFNPRHQPLPEHLLFNPSPPPLDTKFFRLIQDLEDIGQFLDICTIALGVVGLDLTIRLLCRDTCIELLRERPTETFERPL